MIEAKCFNCGKILGIGKPMEELVKDRFPVFCSLNCSVHFPDNHTPAFKDKIKELEDDLR